MKKRTYFDGLDEHGWPTPAELEPYFIASPGRHSPLTWGSEWGELALEGVDGTGHLRSGEGRIDIRLTMVSNRYHGVLLLYRKWGAGHKATYYSQGNLRRLREWVETRDGDLMPVGLFIPLREAWSAVREFIEQGGAQPRSISWIAAKNLPPRTFPDPAERWS